MIHQGRPILVPIRFLKLIGQMHFGPRLGTGFIQSGHSLKSRNNCCRLTVASRMVISSKAKRRITLAFVNNRPATLSVDKIRHTIEQMLITGLKLEELMVT